MELERSTLVHTPRSSWSLLEICQRFFIIFYGRSQPKKMLSGPTGGLFPNISLRRLRLSHLCVIVVLGIAATTRHLGKAYFQCLDRF